MRVSPTTQAIRLRLLALVLALALAWYAMNPAPGPVRRVRREEEQPDEGRREVKSRSAMGHSPLPAEADAMGSVANPFSSEAERGIDELE